MVQLVNINIEGTRHHEQVLAFINERNPDVICLQEATEQILTPLRARGYLTSFAPMCHRTYGTMGIALAAKHPFVASAEYYHRAGLPIVDFDPQRKAETESFVYLSGTFTKDGAKYTIATTHFWDTGNGKPDRMQQELMRSLLERLETMPAHVLCGDFNIPREHNPLYEKLASRYNDTIPLHYPSSLDRSLHRLGNKPIDEPIFDMYMVDYVLTQSPYSAHHTTLHFGVSDHAAITTEITMRP